MIRSETLDRSRRRGWIARAIVLVALPAAALGCNAPPPTEVTGVVTLDGETIEAGGRQRCTVVFHPVGGGALATGLVNPDGAYSVATGGSAEVTPGRYQVSIRLMEATGAVDGEGLPEWTPVTPAIYADPIYSGLLCFVKQGPNRFDIALRSDAGSPLAAEPSPPEAEGDLNPQDEQRRQRSATEVPEAAAEAASAGPSSSPADLSPLSPAGSSEASAPEPSRSVP